MHHYPIESLAYSKSKELLFWTSTDVAIHAFGLTKIDGLNKEKRYYLRGHKRSAKGLLVIEEKNILISSGSDYGIKIWDLEDLSLKYIITAANDRHAGTNMVYLEKENALAVGYNDGIIRTFGISSKKKIGRVDSMHRGSWDSLIFCS